MSHHLVLGGSGAWPDEPEYGMRVRDFETLHVVAETLRRDIVGLR